MELSPERHKKTSLSRETHGNRYLIVHDQCLSKSSADRLGIEDFRTIRGQHFVGPFCVEWIEACRGVTKASSSLLQSTQYTVQAIVSVV